LAVEVEEEFQAFEFVFETAGAVVVIDGFVVSAVGREEY
jgi:hypothetical protein